MSMRPYEFVRTCLFMISLISVGVLGQCFPERLKNKSEGLWDDKWDRSESKTYSAAQQKVCFSDFSIIIVIFCIKYWIVLTLQATKLFK